ncbi:hypothetical protein [Luteibacter sp. UNCMF366Tsu5.1]|nr:hypothetical protein [Luteibacter sp. UNCMF366Tsu5.1]
MPKFRLFKEVGDTPLSKLGPAIVCGYELNGGANQKLLIDHAGVFHRGNI